MPGISASPASNALAAKRTEANTRNLESIVELLLSEVHRLRVGDTSAGIDNVLR